MKRTSIVKLCPDRQQRQTLRLIGDRVSALWNVSNYLCRQAAIKGNKVPSYSGLCSILKSSPDYRALPTHIGQEVIKKLSKAWVGHFRLLKLYKSGRFKDKPGLPGYHKDRKTGKRPFGYIPIKSASAYSIENGCINVTLPPDMRNSGRISISFKGILRYQGKHKTCELKYDAVAKNWYAHIVVEVPEPMRKVRPVKYATGDLGARRTIAISIQNTGLSHVFSSRDVWKDFKYWTRQIARIQSQLSTQGIKTSRRLKQLYRLRRLRLKHGIEALSKKVVSLLKRYGITHFKVGYPKGCRENMPFGKNNGLVHNFWVFDMTLDVLEKHCIRRGIEFERIDETGTSDECCICSLPIRRPVRSKATCPVHGVMHADINASLNMLKGYTPYYGDGVRPPLHG